MHILTHVEPVFVPAETIMFRELDEIKEIIFVQTGDVHIGFEINRRKKFVVQFADNGIIGAYECTFNKKTIFVYKSKTDVKGYMLRKVLWQHLMNDHGKISEFFKENIEYKYLNDIKNRVLQEKHRYMKMLNGKAGKVENFIMLINKDEKPSHLNSL